MVATSAMKTTSLSVPKGQRPHPLSAAVLTSALENWILRSTADSLLELLTAAASQSPHT
jgi:hypothetical protein